MSDLRKEIFPGEFDHYGKQEFPNYRGASERDGSPQIPSGSVWQQGERGSLYLVQWCGEVHKDGREWLLMAYCWEVRWHNPESASFLPSSALGVGVRFNQQDLATEMQRRELRQVDVHFEPVIAFRD